MQEIFGLGYKYHSSKKEIGDLKKILNTAKKIKNYHISFVYLTFEQSLLFYYLCNKFKNSKDYDPKEKHDFEIQFFKNENNAPILLYLTKSQLKKVNEKRSKKENFVLQLTNKQIAETCKETIKMDKKTRKFFEKFYTNKEWYEKGDDDDVNFDIDIDEIDENNKAQEQEELQKKLRAFMSMKPMLTKNSQKAFQGLKKIIESKPKVDNYHQKIVKLGQMQLLSFLKACRDHESDLIFKKKQVNTRFFSISKIHNTKQNHLFFFELKNK